MKEGEKEEEVDVNIEIPPKILKDIWDDSRKWKADNSIDCRHYKAHVSAYGRHLEINLVKILGTWRGIERINLRSTVTGL